jgi:hypothetical protein
MTSVRVQALPLDVLPWDVLVLIFMKLRRFGSHKSFSLMSKQMRAIAFSTVTSQRFTLDNGDEFSDAMFMVQQMPRLRRLHLRLRSSSCLVSQNLLTFVSVQELSLADSIIEYSDAKALMKGLKGNISITRICLERVTLRQGSVPLIGQLLRSLPNLRVVSMMGATHMQHGIDAILDKLTGLRELDLSNVIVGKKGSAILAAILGPTLEVLKISRYGRATRVPDAFADTLGDFVALTKLVVSYTTVPTCVVRAVCRLPLLRELIMYQCICDADAIALLTELVKTGPIVYLRLTLGGDPSGILISTRKALKDLEDALDAKPSATRRHSISFDMTMGGMFPPRPDNPNWADAYMGQ